MKTLTVGEIRKLAKNHKYFIGKTKYENINGINSKAVFDGTNVNFHGNYKTHYLTFEPCSLNEYISHKLPFFRESDKEIIEYMNNKKNNDQQTTIKH